MKQISLFSIVTFILLCPKTLLSQSPEEQNKAAAQATNPLAYVTKLQFQPIYSFLNEGGNQLSFFSRIVQPSKSIGLPFIKAKKTSKFYTIYRLEAPIISQTFKGKLSPLDATGTGDFIVLDVIAHKSSWGLAGLGPGVLMPTASSPSLGLGKWCAGPIGIVIFTKIPKVQLGLLVQQFNSFAGDSERSKQNFMYFQPQVTKLFNKGYFIETFPIMKFDWEKNKYTVPVNLMFGKAFAKDRSMFLGPQYVLNGPPLVKNSWAIMFNINTMFQ